MSLRDFFQRLIGLPTRPPQPDPLQELARRLPQADAERVALALLATPEEFDGLPASQAYPRGPRLGDLGPTNAEFYRRFSWVRAKYSDLVCDCAAVDTCSFDPAFILVATDALDTEVVARPADDRLYARTATDPPDQTFLDTWPSIWHYVVGVMTVVRPELTGSLLDPPRGGNGAPA